MLFSRISAFITVLLLIAAVSFAAISVTRTAGTLITHISGTQVDEGVITKINSPNSFVLKEDSGKIVTFQCIDQCLRGQAHMQRHLIEHANTDVYYKKMPDGQLEAVDVD
jgi:hypothetical protein